MENSIESRLIAAMDRLARAQEDEKPYFDELKRLGDACSFGEDYRRAQNRWDEKNKVSERCKAAYMELHNELLRTS